MSKTLDQKIKLFARTINVEIGTPTHILIKLFDDSFNLNKNSLHQKALAQKEYNDVVVQKDTDLTGKIEKKFTVRELAQELGIDPEKVQYVGGWIDIVETEDEITREYDKEVILKIIKDNLTVFLGGAGMRGNYQYDFIQALEKVGISNVQRGNYSALFYGVDEEYDEFVDMGADASSVIFYNQDTNDPIALQLVDTRGCEIDTEIEFLNIKYRTYKGKTIKNQECPNTFRYELETPSEIEFSLKNIQIQSNVPKSGQFNFIGYSWGSIIASRTALKYAQDGEEIDNLVLIGAPINYSLLQSVQNHANIKNVIIINLTQYGDPIYAGMTDSEILSNALELGLQMKKETGHFYYSVESNDGKIRRKRLAKELYEKGLR